MEQALQLQLSGQNIEALQIFNQIIKENPENDLALYYKAESLAALHDFEKAVQFYKLAIEKNKKPQINIEVLMGLGNAYQKMKKFDLALEQYNKCLEIDNKYRLAHFNIGITYNHLNQWDKSIENFDKAIEYGLKEAYIHKGLTLQKTNRSEEAIPVYDKVISKYPDNPSFYFYKSFALVQLQKLEEAIQCFDKVIQLDPENQEAYIRKESLLNMQGEVEKLKEFQLIMKQKKIQPQINV